MPSDTAEIHVATERPDRSALLARFCDELARILAEDRHWDGEGFMVPWHASAGDLASLPARVVAEILGEWDDAGGQLAGIEFSGYLETDHGPRAWGSLMMRGGEPSARAWELETCEVEPADGGIRIDARLRAKDGGDA